MTVLYKEVVKVFQTLDWRGARKIEFCEVVRQFGVSHTVDVFRIIVHAFAMAGTKTEVFCFLRYVMGYCREMDRGMFETLAFVLDSRELGEGSSVVCNVLIKVFASNSMLGSALDVFFYAKKLGLELEILSCNFLLKFMVEDKEGKLVQILFEEMKISGLSSNVYTYTIVSKFYYDSVSDRRDLDTMKLIELLKDMENHGKNPTVVTCGVYIDELCKAGYVDSAIRLWRSQNQP